MIGTEPYGVTDQDEFLNGALKMETLLTPHELLELLHRIEQEAGRKRIRRWGPRTLDLDIIFYGDQIIEEDAVYAVRSHTLVQAQIPCPEGIETDRNRAIWRDGSG